MFYIVTELFVFLLSQINFFVQESNSIFRVTGGELFDKIVEVGNYTEKDAAILVEKVIPP